MRLPVVMQCGGMRKGSRRRLSRDLVGLVRVIVLMISTMLTGRGSSHDESDGLVILNCSSESLLGLPEEGVDGASGRGHDD